MKTQTYNLQKIVDSIKEYHPISELEIKHIEKAIEILYANATGVKSTEGGIVINVVEHSLSVSQYMASWRFDYSAVVAALLHEVANCIPDIMEKLTNTIDESAIINLNAYIENHSQLELLKKSTDISKEIRHIYNLSDWPPESVYIEIANHIDILSRNVNNNSEAIIRYAQKTRENFIPQVIKINAFKMVNILEELCFQIENKDTFFAVSSIMKKVDRSNECFRQQFIKNLYHIFDRNNNIVSEKIKEFQPYIRLFCSEKRSTISIYRFITQNDADYINCSSFQNDIKKLDNFSRTAYYDLKLVLNDGTITDNYYSPIDVFLKYYEEFLRPDGAFLFGCYNTTKNDSCYFLLSDCMKNMYRFFVMSESEYLRYLYGDIISPEKINLNYSPEKSGAKIKIFRKDGSAEIVDAGTTVLDFAFKIHEDLGLHFSHAILNKNNRALPAHTVLNNGDTIEIITTPNITAEFNWFRYLNSELSINCLIKYFKTQYKRKDSSIKIITQDGQIEWIQAKTTVLDYAFMHYADKGLYFDYALINGSNERFPANYELNDGDNVTICQAQTVQANYNWFRYVKCQKAIDILISYFEKLNFSN